MAIGDYTGVNFNAIAMYLNAHDIAWDGTYFWILEGSTDTVYKYSSSGVYQSFNFICNFHPSGGSYGICYDGTNLIVTSADNKISTYSTSGTFISSVSASAYCSEPTGICFDGTNYYLLDVVAKVYKLDLNLAYVSTYNLATVTSGYCLGIVFDGTYFWISTEDAREVYRFTSTFVYDSFHFDTNVAGNTIPTGITWDGTYFWISDLSRIIYKYNGTIGTFPPFESARLPAYNPSIITSVTKVQQNLPFTQFVFAGQGIGSLYKLFKKTTTQAFTVWRSPVYNIGKDFDVMSIDFNITGGVTTNQTIIPKLYFDNERDSSVGTVINTTNYPNSDKLIKLTPKDFSNTIHGKHNFFLEFQFTGTALAVVSMPIKIETEIYDL